MVPRSAVVRTEGSGWVYVLQGNAWTVNSCVKPSRSTGLLEEAGWFVTNGVTESNLSGRS